MAPRLLRDIRAGVASGRFLKAEPRLARAAVSGAVLAALQMSLTNPELVDHAACDQVVEQLLDAGRAVRWGSRAHAPLGRGAARIPLICATRRPTQAHSPPGAGAPAAELSIGHLIGGTLSKG